MSKLKLLAGKIAVRLIEFSGKPLIANVAIESFEGQSIDGSKIELVDCYQMTVDKDSEGYLLARDDGLLYGGAAP